MNFQSICRSGILILSFLFAACSSGQRSLEKGDYDQAVTKAVSRLQRDAQNRKALSTLKQAYQLAIDDHLDNIREAKLSSNVLRWETVMSEYQALNRLADQIKYCPGCREVLPERPKFTTELEEARLKAAEVRYTRGLKLLDEHNRSSAKQAYHDFEYAENLYPNFKDSKQKLDEAYWAAILKVVVEPVELHKSLYSYSNEFFKSKIYEYLENYEDRSFIKFYTPKEASRQDLVPDQVLTLSFDDFVVGQTYVKEKVEEVKRDSVKIGKAEGKDVYGTVKAEVSVFEKTISSAGLLNVRITDWKTKNVLKQEKIEGTYVWQDRWGSYKGDDRALDETQKKLMKRRESVPPPPQDLFIEFTKPIYTQLTAKLRGFYSRY